MNTVSQLQSDQTQLELGEGLPANSKLAQATYAPVAENQLLLPEHNSPFCSPSCCSAQVVLQGPMVGARLLAVCGQLTSQLVLAHLPLLLQAFKVLHSRSLEDQD